MAPVWSAAFGFAPAPTVTHSHHRSVAKKQPKDVCCIRYHSDDC